MSIVTKPTIQKGQENVITLSKSELASQAKIVSDSYFSNQSNWKQVVLTYESDEGNQVKRVVFDASEATPEGVLELSDKAKNEFEVKTLTIFDYDGGYLKLYRGDLNTAQFDIVIESAVSGGFAFRELGAPAYTHNNNSIDVTSNSVEWGLAFKSNDSFTGDGYFEIKLPSNYDSLGDMIIGLSNSNTYDETYPFFDSIGPCIYLIGGNGQYQIRPNAEGNPISSGSGILPEDIIRFEVSGLSFNIKVNGTSIYEESTGTYVGLLNSVRTLEGIFKGIGVFTNFSFLGAVSGNLVTWDFVPANWITLTNGGLDSNGNTGVARTISNDEDFDFEFNFLDTMIKGDYALGITPDPISLPSFYGLNGGSIWVNGSDVGVIGNKYAPLVSGLNSIRIKRVGSDISIFLNNLLVESATSSSSFYAVARLQGNRLESAFKNF